MIEMQRDTSQVLLEFYTPSSLLKLMLLVPFLNYLLIIFYEFQLK